MPRRTTQEKWDAIRAAWCAGEESVEGIAARFGQRPLGIRQRASRERWPARPDVAHRPEHAARMLYEELTRALHAGLARLAVADGTGETAKQAVERAALVRAHRRALLALLEAGRLSDPKARGAETSASAPPLDLVAARAEIVERLARIGAVPATEDCA